MDKERFSGDATDMAGKSIILIGGIEIMKLKNIFTLLVVLTLSACGPTTPSNSQADTQNTVTIMTQTGIAISQEVLLTVPSTSLPTPISSFIQPTKEFAFPTFAPRSTDWPSPTSIPASLPKFHLNEYVMLFIKGGDLYFQDGDNLPVRLKNVGTPNYELIQSYNLSDDNQKVSLGARMSINSDGTQEKPLLPNGWSGFELWGTVVGSSDFIPGTHKLLFRTCLCNSGDYDTSCVSSLHLIDSDTGEYKKLANLGFSGRPQNESYKISPDGKMIALSNAISIDIINLNGEYIRRDILSYRPNTPDLLFPIVSWLPDSSGLTVGIPNTTFYSIAYNYVPAFTIWRYTMDDNIATQIPLTPNPMAFTEWDTAKISPDGNWILYGGLGNNPEIYLGNLLTSHVKVIGAQAQARFSWAPDSKHFIITSAGSTLGSIDGSNLLPIGSVGQWIDAEHFLWFTQQGSAYKTFIAEIIPGGITIYDIGIGEDVTIIALRPR